MPAEPPLPARRGMSRRGHLAGRVRPSGDRPRAVRRMRSVCGRLRQAGRPRTQLTPTQDGATLQDTRPATRRGPLRGGFRTPLRTVPERRHDTLHPLQKRAALPRGAGRTVGTDPLEHLESAPRRRIQRTREARTGLCGPPANVLLADRGRACAAGRARLPGGGDSPAAAGAARRGTAAATCTSYRSPSRNNPRTTKKIRTFAAWNRPRANTSFSTSTAR